VTDAAVAIANLVFLYAERVDLGDFDGVGDLFAAATYRALAGDTVTTLEGSQVAALLRKMVITGADGTPGTKHVTTNLIIEADEDASAATCRSYYTVLQAGTDRAIQPIIAGRYHDTFARIGDEWRFTDRLIFSDLIGDLGRHLRHNPY
jgi:hypothetical protein